MHGFVLLVCLLLLYGLSFFEWSLVFHKQSLCYCSLSQCNNHVEKTTFTPQLHTASNSISTWLCHRSVAEYSVSTTVLLLYLHFLIPIPQHRPTFPFQFSSSLVSLSSPISCFFSQVNVNFPWLLKLNNSRTRWLLILYYCTTTSPSYMGSVYTYSCSWY